MPTSEAVVRQISRLNQVRRKAVPSNDEIKEQFEDDSDLEPDEWGGCMVPAWLEVLITIKERKWVGARLPPVETLREWRRRYIAVWDATIDDLEPTAEYRTQRRSVLEETSDRAIALAIAEDS